MSSRELTQTVADVPEGDQLREFSELIAAPIVGHIAPVVPPSGGVVVGTLVGFIGNGATPVVTFPGPAGAIPVSARTTLDLHAPHVGRQVVLVFEEGDLARPIITGCIRQPDDRASAGEAASVPLDVDGERLVVSAVHGLVLRCGKASITLNPNGKIVVRGTDLVSHASGINRIKGGSVQVN